MGGRLAECWAEHSSRHCNEREQGSSMKGEVDPAEGLRRDPRSRQGPDRVMLCKIRDVQLPLRTVTSH